MTAATIERALQDKPWTAKEIAQQPETLLQTLALIKQEKNSIEGFLEPLLSQKDCRIILTGAGTSSFIGDCLAPWLNARLDCRVESVATTDIVAAPEIYLEKDTPTLLVSFGRSGNSPESVAAADLADKYVSDCSQLAITCNGDGALVKRICKNDRGYAVLLPEATHDRGFAMTSSFTSMMLAALVIFSDIDGFDDRVPAISKSITASLKLAEAPTGSLARAGFERAVFLGSHIFMGLSHEASLKLLELTDGELVALHDSPLGFRHGPKTIMNPKTLMIVMMSNDELARKYETDLVEELKADPRMGHLLLLDTKAGENTDRVTHITIPDMNAAEDADLLFPYIAVAQSLALEFSMAMGMTPDQPSRFGNVNRVVQGVKIHEPA